MTDPMSIENQLRELGDCLKQGADLAPRVMTAVERLAADATAGPDAARLSSRRSAMTALAVAVAATVAVMVSLRPMDPAGSVVFAQVQEAIRQVETAVLVHKFPDVSWINHTTMYRRDSDVVRTEWPSGIVELRDVTQGKKLMLNPKRKTAYTDSAPRKVPLLNMAEQVESPRQLLDRLAGIEASAVERLGEREFDGRKLVGFGLPKNKAVLGDRMNARIWVDPQSRLPVHYELLSDDPTHLASHYWRQVTTFTFNRPLEASLFQMTVPDGYAEEKEPVDTTPYLDRFPAPPQDARLASPVVEPTVGLGPAHFGMPAERVIEVMGRPDDVSEYWEPTAQEQREVNEAFKKAGREADEKGLKGRDKALYIRQATSRLASQSTARPAAGVTLDYHGRGFALMVAHDQGLIRIFCKGPGQASRPFTGKTSKGIGIGATAREVEDAYGPAEIKREGARGALYYKPLQLLFDLRDDKVWQISLDNPNGD